MKMGLISIAKSIQQQSSHRAIFDLFQTAIGAHGFHSFIVSGLPDRGMDMRPFVLLSAWNTEWFDRYANRGYVHVDPVARYCFVAARPFDWSEAHGDARTDLRAQQIVHEAREFGMIQGYCVPVRMVNGMQGMVSIVGETAHLTEQVRIDLHMLALSLHARLGFLSTIGDLQKPRRAITPREAEVLKWAATGKTAPEIAEITGLTVRTINQHCENAQKRLGTSNRLHTVVEAIRHKLISV